MSRGRRNSPLRVTHVTTVPLSLRFLRGQAAWMRDRGVELRAVSSPGPLLDEFGRDEGVPTHGIPMSRRITPADDALALARLVAHFRETSPDIVHAHTPKGGLLGMIAATLAGVPVRLYHMRGLPLMGASGTRRALLTLTERVSCALADEVFCVSHSLRAVAVELGLVSAERVRVLAGGSGQGVDARGRFDPARVRRDRGLRDLPEDALVYGFVGRLVRDKGVHELAEAWRAVRESSPRAHLLLVGPREDTDPIDDAVWAELSADPRVRTVGFTDDTPAEYARMDVLVLPTYREGFPNAPLEAAAMEIPVVATQIPGCVDAVADGVTGLLVPARDAAALAEAMRRYGDPELRAAHGAAGRRRVLREFAREAIWDALAERYLHHGGRAPDAPARARSAARG